MEARNPQGFHPEISADISIGVVGGGQLARMMMGPAAELGLELKVFSAEQRCPAAAAVTAVGSPADPDALCDFARSVSALTFEHEQVPASALEAVLSRTSTPIRPHPQALQYAQDKLALRRLLSTLGLPQPRWAEARSQEELQSFLLQLGAAASSVAVVKLPRGGYDGRGVRRIRHAAEVADWFQISPSLLVEEEVPFLTEASQLIARGITGGTRCWRLTETFQSGGVCAATVTPLFAWLENSGGGISEAELSRLETTAIEYAETLAHHINALGVMAVEMYVLPTPSGLGLSINEIAMRPHNSGHWTIEGAWTSQFAQHLRAVAGLPLGEPEREPAFTPAVMVNILGGAENLLRQDAELRARLAANKPGENTITPWKTHIYGKQRRPGRKVGHSTALRAMRGEPPNLSVRALLEQQLRIASSLGTDAELSAAQLAQKQQRIQDVLQNLETGKTQR